LSENSVKNASETKIDISELKSEGSDVIRDLSQIMREKTKADVQTLTDTIIIKGEGKAVPRTYVRVLLKKFLHKQGLKEYFRVIGGKENTIMIKEIKVAEEE
jgi:hypothetical protein